MDIINFFNQLSGKFIIKFTNGRMVFFSVNLYKKIFNDINIKLKFQPADEVLDLGGGTGLIAKYISQTCSRLELTDGAELAIAEAKRNLKNYNNIDFSIINVEKPLPFADNNFDKIVCYSVVHYLNNFQSFKNLINELIRIVKADGLILIGDIPLDEKYKSYLKARQQKPFSNFMLNQKYYFKKNITKLFYKLAKIELPPSSKIFFTKNMIFESLSEFNNIKYNFLEQNKKLPFFGSREDLIIKKIK